MARHCTYNTGQYLVRSGVPVGSPPLTLSLWVKMATYAQFAGCLCNSSADSWFNIGSTVSNPGATAAYEYDGTNVGRADTTGIPTGSWAHLCAVFTSHSSRSVFLNGAAKVTNSVACSAITVNQTLVGTAYVGGAIYAPNFGGDLAEFAIWNVALSDAEVAQLASGLSADQVHGANLVAYYQLQGIASPEPDAKGGTGLTVVGATPATHPPIIYAGTQVKGQMLAVF